MGTVKSKPSADGAPSPSPSPSPSPPVEESSHHDDTNGQTGQQPPRRSFHEALMRVRDHKHDFNDIYEMMDEIGQGGICKIYKIKKKDEMMGGSSREENVRKHKFSLLSRMNSLNKSPARPRPKTITRGYSGDAPEGAHMYFALKVINLALVKEDSIDQLQNEGTISEVYCIQVPSASVSICVLRAELKRPVPLRESNRIVSNDPRFGLCQNSNLTSSFLLSLCSRDTKVARSQKYNQRVRP
jgi:hypothetical protein